MMMWISCDTHRHNTNPETFQKEWMEFYANPETTPLNEEERARFKGLEFYPIDKQYTVEASFSPVINGETVTFATSANKTKQYQVAGTITFTINDTPCQLTLYSSPSMDDELFLPFRDATSGISSYGAGRYINISRTQIRQGKLILDFNLAYNPYCAYSEQYNCPIPPIENTLPVAIKAGAKYEHHSEEEHHN